MDLACRDDCGYVHCYRCNEEAESFEEKCRNFRHLSNRHVERSTIHPRRIVLPQRNLRSLKYLTTAQPQTQLWHATCPY